MAKQVVISQGFSFSPLLTLPESDSAWMAALYCPSTNKRYIADTDGEVKEGEATFTWQSGLKEDGSIDPDKPNGTAHMSKGIYRLEIFTSDRTRIGFLNDFARVEDSNLMAKNAQEVNE